MTGQAQNDKCKSITGFLNLADAQGNMSPRAIPCGGLLMSIKIQLMMVDEGPIEISQKKATYCRKCGVLRVNRSTRKDPN